MQARMNSPQTYTCTYKHYIYTYMTHSHFLLQNIRSDLRLELNLKDLQVDTFLFSAIAVMPNGP